MALSVPPVVVVAYDGIAADEAGVVVERLSAAGLDVVIASVEEAPVTSYHGRVVVARSVAELGPCSALVVPGGMGVRTSTGDARLLRAIEELAHSATWLGSTSTGSALLAAAGAVDGARATTHWLAGDLLTARGIAMVNEPFVEHGRLLTASGVVSAATLAFRLVGALAGVEAETEIRAHYRPRPPADTRPRPRRRPWWRTIGRKRVAGSNHPIDPTGATEVVVLDLGPYD
jgi:transcriptional regulator GlxA family with amidase domain